MPQSLAQVYVHLVFSTKMRRPYLKDEAMQSAMHAYVAGICRKLDSPTLDVDGTEDHVHALIRLSRNIAIADLLRNVKRDSSKWCKAQCKSLREFQWQAGYGAFSISPSHVEALLAYIANQKKHHRKETYQDEFRRLCQLYGVKLDERYAWE